MGLSDLAGRALYKNSCSDHIDGPKDSDMRAETLRTIDEIRSSLALLRRHL